MVTAVAMSYSPVTAINACKGAEEMRKLVRVCTFVLWFIATIWIAIALDGSTWFSTDPFLRRLEIHLLMVGTVSFIYGLVFRRTLS